MRASEIVRELNCIIESEGDLEVDVSVAKQKSPVLERYTRTVPATQQYLVADAKFVLVEHYEDPEEKRISIRDWPY